MAQSPSKPEPLAPTPQPRGQYQAPRRVRRRPKTCPESPARRLALLCRFAEAVRSRKEDSRRVRRLSSREEVALQPGRGPGGPSLQEEVPRLSCVFSEASSPGTVGKRSCSSPDADQADPASTKKSRLKCGSSGASSPGAMGTANTTCYVSALWRMMKWRMGR